MKRKTIINILIFLILSSVIPVSGVERNFNQPKLKWWQDARFGMFIHWGPVTLTGQELSWSRTKVGIERYDNLYKKFNPVGFDAKEWVRAAKETGMKYIVLTAKHHDGFCLWNTQTTDYNIMHTPFGRDVCKELADAAHDEGVHICWYYSPADMKDVDCRNVSTNDVYVERSLQQLRELLTNYGKIDLLWIDYEGGPSPVKPDLIYKLANELQPGIIVNNRLDVLHTDESHSMIGPNGDYATPEGFVAGYGNIPWETCTNLGHQWAWKWNDTPRSLKEAVTTLLKCAGGNGNLLLNVGPDSLGVIPSDFMARLQDLGKWLKPIGESVYGTRGGPYSPSSSYVCTSKGSKLYLHIFKFDGDTLALPPLPAKVKSAMVMTGGKAEFVQTKGALKIIVPKSYRRDIATTVELVVDKEADKLGIIRPLSTTGSLAYNARVTASGSVGQFLHDGMSAVDDNPSTCWVIGRRKDVNVDKYFGTKFHYIRDSIEIKNIFDDKGWLEIDLGKPQRVGRVKLIERKFLYSKILDFEVQYKKGNKWITWVRDTDMGKWERDLPEVTARYFRLVINKRRYMAGVCEFQLFPPIYTNPVIAGFFPDPSTIRVGDDYYTINSTFQYFPALAISHSKDLVHWEQVSYVFNDDNPIDLTHFYDGCGLWAPDISYYNGEYYVFYCLVQLKKDRSVNVRGNYMTKSKSIFGPWSKPVQLTTSGSDPSHFVDDDGEHYMLYAAGIPTGNGTLIVKLNKECTKVVEGPFWMETDGKKAAPEGPHLLKKDGYYYFMMAASSGLFNGHHQLIARSKNIYGPYESFPGNPFVAQFNPNALVEHQGHGKMFSTQNGDWYITLLSQRRTDAPGTSYGKKGVSQLGRETSLYPVRWGKDKWPYVCDRKGLPDSFERPNLPLTLMKTKQSDEFSVDTLGIQWLNVRNPIYEERTLTERPGWLRLYTGNYTLNDIQARNIVVQRETDKKYTATLKMDFKPQTVEQAGLLCYYDTHTYASFSLRKDDDKGLKLVVEENRGRDNINKISKEVAGIKEGPLYLRVKVNNLRREFLYSYDNKKWMSAFVIDNAAYLSDEGTPNWGFMGTMVGMYALNCGSGIRIPADFDSFEYEPD